MSETNNFLAGLEGADLQRQIENVKYSEKHKLKITKYTQGGLNMGSGNVWLWDEDWPACIYTNINFDTCLSWSCPECGEEVDCETVSEAQELNDSFNETGGCAECLHS